MRDERATQGYLLLRRARGDVRLRPGQATIGRGSACDVVLVDAQISRQHARLTVGSDSAVVEDLGSSNGVYVNGGRIDGKRTLRHGDVLRIGSEDLLLLFFEEDETSGRREVKTTPGARVDDLVPRSDANDEGDAPTLEVDGLDGLADQILATGGAAEAERMLSAQMAEVLKRARTGDLTDGERVAAATFAARLAGGTRKGAWLDYAVELYALANVPPPESVVDLLEAAASLVDEIDAAVLGAYLRQLRALEDRFDEGARARLRRLEELEQSVGWA